MKKERKMVVNLENSQLDLIKTKLLEILKSSLIDLHMEGLQTAFLVGSMANNEATIEIDTLGNIVVSDIDIILDLTIKYFFKYRLFKNKDLLSKQLSYKLAEKGYKTHVSIGLTCLSVCKFLPSTKPNSLFLFELKPFYSLASSEYNLELPSKYNSFDLAISSLADYVFLVCDDQLTDEKKIYIIIKRCLTLLNSLMIFEDLAFKGYVSRYNAAKKNRTKLRSILTEIDLKYIHDFTAFKISGNLTILYDCFGIGSRNMEQLLFLLNNYFKAFALKIINRELSVLINSAGPNNIDYLLMQYLEKNKLSSFKKILYCLKVFPAVITFEKKRTKTALYSLLCKDLEINVILRFLIIKEFLRIFHTTTSERTSFYKKEAKAIWDLFPV